MKIAYLLDDDISLMTGIIKKIKTKIELWKKDGHQVKVYSLRSKNLNSIIDEGIIISKFSNNNFIGNFFQQYNNIKKLDKELEKFKPDLIYTRYMKYYPNMVKILKKHSPYIVELNSNDVEEYKHRKKIIYLYNLFTRNYLLKNSSGFVSVSNEIINNINFSKFKKEHIIIGNGYKFETFRKKEKSKNLNLIFIGTPNQSWHGVDKLIYLADKLPEYKFHLLGPNENDIKKLGLEISKNIKIYGFCDSERVQEILDISDLGISSLALHRNNMIEASPLKSRQYLANGLPIIIGYTDTDLPEGCNYILNISNYENNIKDNIQKIKTFCENIKGLDSKYIFESSKIYLDQENKEKQRLKFFSKILEEKKNEN